MEWKEIGIEMVNVSRGYGSTKVIDNLNMNCFQGSIYGLLGPSGCGKTTLLKLLIGRMLPDSGTVKVLGAKPHTAHHHIPGARIGYAPQELALYPELTIEETFLFHASLHGMKSNDFRKRMRWLLEFLELPKASRRVGKLSGGQQRRVSLAVSMLHSPQLLILDEPTVGLDPLLRLRIWEYLKTIAKSGVSIVITTHYIEEARHADRVGLMRSGCLLDEGSPDNLMKKYDCSSLEDVFLSLCRSISSIETLLSVKTSQAPIAFEEKLTQQAIKGLHTRYNGCDSTIEESTSLLNVNYSENVESSNDSGNEALQSKSLVQSDRMLSEKSPVIDQDNTEHNWNKGKRILSSFTWKRVPFQIFSIGRKTFTQLLRNPLALSFELLVPLVQIILFILCVGPDPSFLPFAVLNLDVGYQTPNQIYINLGNNTVVQLQSGNELKLSVLSVNTSLNDAISLVKNGDVWGVLYIPEEFSYAYFWRFLQPRNETIQKESTEYLYMDLSNYQISLVIQKKIQTAFEEVITQYMNTSVNPIVVVEPAVYGSSNTKFSDFLAPAMIALMTFAHSIGITAIAFVRERLDATIDRIFAAGVASSTIIIAHLLTHTILSMVQTGLLLGTVLLFEIPIQGYIVVVFCLLLLTSWSGMSLGLLISSVAQDERDAMQLSLASFFPAMLLSGVLWPVEAIPQWFSWLSLALPTTHIASAMRSIMIRGWDLRYEDVWMAYVIAAAWTVVMLCTAVWRLKSVDTPNYYGCKKKTWEI